MVTPPTPLNSYIPSRNMASEEYLHMTLYLSVGVTVSSTSGAVGVVGVTLHKATLYKCYICTVVAGR